MRGGADERALLRRCSPRARAFLKPFGRFLRRDSQLRPMMISSESLGGPYNNRCREPSHHRPLHPRPQGSPGSRGGPPHLLTDLGPSPSRGSTPPSSYRRKVQVLSFPIPRFRFFWGGRGARIRTIPTYGVQMRRSEPLRRIHDGVATR